MAIAASKLPATKNTIGSRVDGLTAFGPIVVLGLGLEVVVDVPPLLGPEFPEEPDPDGGTVPAGGGEPEGGLIGGLLELDVTLVTTVVSCEAAREDDPVTWTL